MVANIHPHWRVDVRPKTARGIVEAGSIADPALKESTGEIINAIGQLVPDRMRFIGGRVCGRLTPLMVDDQGVLGDHGAVVVQGIDHRFFGDRGQPGSIGEYTPLHRDQSIVGSGLSFSRE